MAKTKTVFYCTNCGNETPKWMGRCPSCGAYNTMEEHVEKPVAAGKAKSAPVGMSRKPQRIREITSDGEIRFSTGMGELDRVLGGGAVAGSLVLVGGAPGIGKSTLLLQICSSLCVGRRVLYVSGEESERQLASVKEQTHEMLVEAGEKGQEKIDAAKAAAARLLEEQEAEASRKAEEIIKKARQLAELEQQKEREALKEQFGQLVALAAAQVTGKMLTEEDQRRINREAIDSLDS